MKKLILPISPGYIDSSEDIALMNNALKSQKMYDLKNKINDRLDTIDAIALATKPYEPPAYHDMTSAERNSYARADAIKNYKKHEAWDEVKRLGLAGNMGHYYRDLKLDHLRNILLDNMNTRVASSSKVKGDGLKPKNPRNFLGRGLKTQFQNSKLFI